MTTGTRGANRLRRQNQPKDRTGVRYGRLVGVRLSHVVDGDTFWEFRCDCGTLVVARACTVAQGKKRSCGCLHRETGRRVGQSCLKHGATIGGKSAEYGIWQHIIKRCEDPNEPHYEDYGGRGIGICAKWRHDFAAFLADVGPRPSAQHTIDRYPNNDGNYEPGNTRWATRAEQQRNRRNNVNLTLGGKTQCLADWATELGWSRSALGRRVRRLPIEQALIPRAASRCAARFSDDQVRSIRRRRAAKEPLATLATELGITEAMVSAIARGKSYQHVRDSELQETTI